MSHPVYKNPNDFKVLFLYPNIQMSALAPQNIGLLSAMLKENGFQTKLFDSTFYRTNFTTDTNEEKVFKAMVLPFNWAEKGIEPQTGDLLTDFRLMVEEYQPDLLAVSVVENTWFIADIMLKSLQQKIPTLVGGVFATYAPEIVIQSSHIDYVCRGEGEQAIVELCKKMAAGTATTDVQGIWAKDEEGKIYRNPMRPTLNVNELPFPDWDIFDTKSLYRPMQGRVYKTIGLETQRGCPYTCTYCNSPSNNVLYKKEGAGYFHRKKTIKRVAEELAYMAKKYQPEFIYMVVDTFLAMRDEELAEFAAMYLDYKVPFWMNTRAETVNEWRGEKLEEMGMLRMNIGIEHGNQVYRRDMLKRSVTNERTVEAFQSVAGAKFTTVANSIIGLPDETRELVFDTIRLNRSLPKETEASGAFIFTPYHGTPLRQIAIDRGYLDPGTVCSLNITKGSVLEMPQFPAVEVQGLCRVFSFYVKMPEERWGEIAQAEKFTPEGNAIFIRLQEEFNARYRRSNINPKDSTSFDLVAGQVPDLHG